MTFRVFAPLIFAVAAVAQPPADQKPATIEGTVVNSVTGAPLRKVDLTLANGEIPEEMAGMIQQFGPGVSAKELPKATTKTLTATTDAAGKFRFEQVTPGIYWLTAKKVGFGDGRYSPKGGGGTRGSLSLSAGQEMNQVDFRLVPQGTVSGHVLDEDGEPFPTAMVSAVSYTYAQGHRRLTPVDMAQTNNRGEFSLSKLPPGHYFLCADVMRVGFPSKAPPPPADGAPETALVGTYFPNSLDVAQAEKVDVAAGAELTGFNIRLQKSRVVRVKGKLTDANGEPIKTAQIMMMGGGGRFGSMSMSMVNNPEGKFEIANVQPGTYTVMTMQMQGPSPKISMQPLIVPERNVENVELGTRPEATIQGKVVVDGDAKIDIKEFAVMLTPGGGLTVMPVSGKADQAGVFTLNHVTPASYDLTLPHIPEGAYLKSVMFNEREALGQELNCGAIAAGTLRIILGTDGGKVEGRVSREDKPAANATVVLLPAEPGRRFPEAVRTGSSDETGHITLKDVPPGDYLAFAWEEVETGIWFDPDFVKAALTQAVKVKIGQRGNEQVELKLIPASK